MLMPKRVKYRKQMRGRMRGKALRGAEVSFGDFGLQALEPGWVSARQIEAARRALVRVMKRRGKVWIRIFPDKPYTQKPPETRMGKGKGNVEYWVAVVKPGRMMFEIAGLDNETSIEAMHQASYKFSIRTKVVARHDVQGQPEQPEQPEGAGEQE
ncbi:MAG TPA: 50S ribosomal protein L16 [Anaerolineaceae bacterium]|jgi:large subunit ribosomal protein L16